MRTSAFLVLALALLPAVRAGAQTKVTIKMGDNLPDRNNTWGAIVEQINSEFKAAHPGLEIVTESYPDQPYQQKIRIYATAKQLPDVFKFWSVTSLFRPLVEGGFVAPLDRAEFDGLGYLPGALDTSTYNGKLYGIPVSTDLWVIYYNKKLFKDAGIDHVPTTLDELYALIPRFKARGIIPMTTDGKDAWPLSITFDQLVWRISGDKGLPRQALERKIKFTDPVFVQAAGELQRLVSSGLFHDDLMVSDYGAARNLFGQGKAAMYLMGSWELGLGADKGFSQEFRSNVDVFKFPTVKAGKGTIDDLMAWYGGNYVVSASSKNPALGKQYLVFYAKRFPELAWDKQATLPAQAVKPRPADTPVARSILRIIAEAVATSGTPSLDLSTPRFKDDHENAIRELCSGLITPQAFVAKLEAAAQKAAKK
ncbi:MAG TPA: extracellular solute-binding protein [Kofleriaceae bacterium]|nr:extracellular solute-binding protein [Kofleriaceae bacterium]HMG51944.1 extracellular solute-binding protein [Kofleriaceae bacterium]